MDKISFRLESEITTEIDNLVDHIRIKNRSQAIKLLLKKALGRERTAVIVSKGADNQHQNLIKDLLINKTEYNMTANMEGKTLLEHNVKKLKKAGFTTIYIVTIKEITEKAKQILAHHKDISIHYIKITNEKTAEALHLLDEKITTPFLTIFGDVYFDIDLEELYEEHMNNNAMCTLTVIPTKHSTKKGNVIMTGRKLIEFVEKPKDAEQTLVFEPIFMANPTLFEQKGISLSYDVFPKLAKKGFLEGRITPSNIIHLHNQQDKKKIALFI